MWSKSAGIAPTGEQGEPLADGLLGAGLERSQNARQSKSFGIPSPRREVMSKVLNPRQRYDCQGHGRAASGAKNGSRKIKDVRERGLFRGPRIFSRDKVVPATVFAGSSPTEART